MNRNAGTAILLFLIAIPLISGQTQRKPSRLPQISPNEFSSVIQIEFERDEYTFSLAEAKAGIAIPYRVVVPNELEGVVPISQLWGNGGNPTDYGLMLLAELTNKNKPKERKDLQYYGLKDLGPAKMDGERHELTINKGEHTETFKWSGRNWLGPSDTSNKLGEPFPPGNYVLTVSCKARKKLNDKRAEYTFRTSNGTSVVLTE